MKKTIYILLFMFVGLQTFSQSTDDKAKAAYLKASEEFDNGSYQSCINKLEEAKDLLGKSNARIQYLIVKSYWQLENYKQTKAELQKYFNFNPKVDNWYKEMTELTEMVDEKLLQIQQKEIREKEEKRLLEEKELAKKREMEKALQEDNIAWEEAKNINTLESYQNYIDKKTIGNYVSIARDRIFWLKAKIANNYSYYMNYIAFFPNGEKIKEAKEAAEELGYKEAMEKNTIASYEEYYKNYPYGKYYSIIISKLDLLYFNDAEYFYNKSEYDYAKKKYQLYINKFPNGEKINKAKERIELINIRDREYYNTIANEYKIKKNKVNLGAYSILLLGSVSFVGAYYFMDKYENTPTYPGISTDYLVPCIAAVSVGCFSTYVALKLSFPEAEKLKNKENEYRNKAKSITYNLNPVINPVNNTFGMAFTIKF